jgi:hypothetical protein
MPDCEEVSPNSSAASLGESLFCINTHYSQERNMDKINR